MRRPRTREMRSRVHREMWSACCDPDWQAELQKRFRLCPTDYVVYREGYKPRGLAANKSGRAAGHPNRRGGGRVQINVGQKSYQRSHIVLGLLAGFRVPKGLMVDHQDGNPANDDWRNLRVVTHGENGRNQKRRANGRRSAGVRRRAGDRWAAEIKYKGRDVWLGTFDTEAEAIAARRAAERRYGFHKNHGRRS